MTGTPPPSPYPSKKKKIKKKKKKKKLKQKLWRRNWLIKPCILKPRPSRATAIELLKTNAFCKFLITFINGSTPVFHHFCIFLCVSFIQPFFFIYLCLFCLSYFILFFFPTLSLFIYFIFFYIFPFFFSFVPYYFNAHGSGNQLGQAWPYEIVWELPCWSSRALPYRILCYDTICGRY